MELAKAYDPQEAQAKWLAFWNERGYFHAEPDPAKKPFAIVIPPPNVTGALHMGHALNNTIQDILVRYHRAKGECAMWMPGTDHAGIATQAVVERLVFQQEKKTRRDLGRDELVKRIWEWKDKYEARILGQLRQMGSSCDWDRTRFTLDDTCARAVRQTFFNMFKDGLIFRGKRLVNWDAQLQTSVADDETYTEDVQGSFWTFKYPVKPADGRPWAAGDEVIRFSTTRPETMLGDTAVCVHPSDPRYQHLIGQKVTIPLVNRDIPIIADGQLADPELGTGCVKVTPAHDPNDYACYQRHPEIGIINILNPDGTINAEGGKYQGLDRIKAREAIVTDMDALGFFEGKEDRVIPMKYSDRSKTPIEPYLSDQWFVRMRDFQEGERAAGLAPAEKGLAQIAMDAVNDGRIKIFPERYARSYLDWLGEKRDWCISRQLWWGHRIPVWYLKRNLDEIRDFLPVAKLTRGDTEVEASSEAYILQAATDPTTGETISYVCIAPGRRDIEEEFEALGYVQDPDVLDTWFSSALWPYSTLGWPEQTPELKYWYPTSVLCTSRDIITLWVARMVLTGLYNLNEIPFHHVYIHPKILDGFGETMSKTKGNGIDPLDIIDRYGADALRFSMAHLATENQDSRMPVANVCPHCDTLVPVKQEHMSMRTKKIACPNCKQPFRPGGPWPSDDPELKTAKQASERFELGRNFANKIWNAARFLLMNLDGYVPGASNRVAALPIEDRWILSRLATTTAAITRELDAYHFSEVARLLYDFVWTEFCDWYVEMAKGRLKNDDRTLVQDVLVNVLDGICRLIQPIMPFLAESVWTALNEAAPIRGLQPVKAGESVVIAPWPSYGDDWIDAAIEKRIGRMQELIRAVREVRNRYNIEPRTPLTVAVRSSAAIASDFAELAPFITQLAGVGSLTTGPDAVKPTQAASHVTPEFEVDVSLSGLINVEAELKRLAKQIADKKKSLQATEAKLANPSFVDKAPPDVITQQRGQADDLKKQIATLEANAAELGKA
ncbi:MAG: valine--tRNA ligase [Planctomycetota bacterium]